MVRRARSTASSRCRSFSLRPATTTSSSGVGCSTRPPVELLDGPDAEPAGQLQHDGPIAGEAEPGQALVPLDRLGRRPDGWGCRSR